MCWCCLEDYRWAWAWDEEEGNGTLKSCQCQCCDGRTWEGWMGGTYWCCVWVNLYLVEKKLADKACHGFPPKCCDVWKCCLMAPLVILSAPFIMCWSCIVCSVSTGTLDVMNRCGEDDRYDPCQYRFMWEGENYSDKNKDDVVTGPWSPASTCACLCCLQQEPGP